MSNAAKPNDWTKPAAMAIPKDGYFKLEQGRYGPIFPRTPANYGFSIIAKVKPGREQTVRDYANTIEAAVKADPTVLASLKLHYLRWNLFDVGSGLHFQYMGIFDTDFDKYLEDAVALFVKTGITTVFVNLEGWPEDWKTNLTAVIKFFRDHQRHQHANHIRISSRCNCDQPMLIAVLRDLLGFLGRWNLGVLRLHQFDRLHATQSAYIANDRPLALPFTGTPLEMVTQFVGSRKQVFPFE